MVQCRHMKNKFLTWFTVLGPWQLLAAGLVVGFGMGIWIFGSGEDNTTKLFTVTKSRLVQEVNVAGKIEAEQNVTLGFETSGTVVALGADVGDQVAAGQALASLDGAELRAQVASAQANAAAEQARLDELKSGTRPEELAITQSALAGAEASLRNSITAAYTASDNAVRNQTDAFFTDPRTSGARVRFEISDFNTDFWLHNARVALEQEFTNWKQELTNLSTINDLSVAAAASQEHLRQVALFLDRLALAVNGIPSSVTTSNGVTVAEARADIGAARTSVINTITTLSNATESYNSNKRELSLKQAGATTQSIQAQQARVAQAKAQVQNLEVQLNKTVLRAPFAGLVTRQDAKLGQSVTPGTSLVTLMANGALKVTAKVPEVDIGKVAVGNHVEIHLDAFPEANFAGTVSKVDPAETILDGVVNYQITITFDQQDPRLRSGLTANLDIITQDKEVLVLPQTALLQHNNALYVHKVVQGKQIETTVTTGIIGQDELVEVLTGLQEGDIVLNPATTGVK